MIDRIIIAPRWAGRSTSDWYPWITAALADSIEVRALDLPEPQSPTIDGWTRGLAEVLGPSPDALDGALLVGHSVGCRALLHYLSRTGPEVAPARGLLCVAGWWTVDRPWPSIVPWIDEPIDLARVRAAAPRIVALLSDDDPFTSDHQANRALWEGRLGAAVELVPGARHFNAAEEPAVVAALRRHFGVGRDRADT